MCRWRCATPNLCPRYVRPCHQERADRALAPCGCASTCTARACAPSTTWWTSPTSSCWKPAIPCTPLTWTRCEGHHIIVRRAHGGRAHDHPGRQGPCPHAPAMLVICDASNALRRGGHHGRRGERNHRKDPHRDVRVRGVRPRVHPRDQPRRWASARSPPAGLKRACVRQDRHGGAWTAPAMLVNDAGRRGRGQRRH